LSAARTAELKEEITVLKQGGGGGATAGPSQPLSNRESALLALTLLNKRIAALEAACS
jgi:hypothetical protein